MNDGLGSAIKINGISVPELAVWQIYASRWGRAGDVKMVTFNARAETTEIKPSFRDVVPVKG